MKTLPMISANAADGVAMRLLYPTHDNSYDPSLASQTSVANNKSRLSITWTNRDPSRPLHTKVMYTIQETSGKGAPFAYVSAYRDNTGALTVEVPKGNVYTICIAGANYREDQTFPGRCISVSTKDYVELPRVPQSQSSPQNGRSI